MNRSRDCGGIFLLFLIVRSFVSWLTQRTPRL
jgi:hypothetical protein